MINIKKLLMLTLIPLVLSVMVAPAMAKPIGPLKSNNPHIEITDEGAGHTLPSGGVHEWMADTQMMAIDFMHALNASKAKGIVHKALPLTIPDILEAMTNPAAALEAENKWWYMSQAVLEDMFTMELIMEYIVAHPEFIIDSALADDAAVGQPNVTVVDANLFSAGDKVVIYYFNLTTMSVTMEYNVIKGKEDNTLTMENNLVNTYTVAAVSKVVKLTPERQAMVEAMAAMWPDGMYVRFVNVGPTWDA